MASRRSPRSRRPSDDDSDSAPRAPATPRRGRHSDEEDPTPKKRRHRSRYASGYSMPREKTSKVDLLFCVFHGGTSHSWRTAPFSFDRRRADDRELWEDIRRIYRHELQMAWRRIFLFKRLKVIAPIEYTSNDVPIRKDKKDVPDSHTFMHAYHHPDRIRPDHEWVDYFAHLKSEDPRKTYGLEFVEGLWAEKLAIVAIIVTIAIVVVSIVWSVNGGDLQTVFTVMSFVLTGAAAEIALVALYYQVTLPG